MHRVQLQTGHSDSLQVDLTEEAKYLSFRKGENHSFLKVYVGYSIDRSCTYVGCSIDMVRTYTSYIIYKSTTCWYFWYRITSGTRLIRGYWYRLVTECWHILVQVYSGISHSDSVAVVSSFNLYFRTVGQGKDRWL
jgi:hypothetical protein